MEKIKKLLTEKLGTQCIFFDEPLYKHTTFKIGGPCDIFIKPESTEQIIDTIKICKEENVPYYVIGKGSNILFSDKGFRGVIICISQKMSNVLSIDKSKDSLTVTARAGIMLSKLANEILENEGTGFEFASGIPGTLGGAVTMNAGAYGGEINDCIVSCKVLLKDGQIKELLRKDLKLGYRTSIIQEEEMIVLEATFSFKLGNKEEIKEKMNDFNKRRKDKQPLEYPSAGSTFKRPTGYFAGKLIMDAGLAGYSIGDACVSDRHCGFVINKGKATAKDTLELMKYVDKTVYDKFGVHLEPEVRIIGEF